jgi:GNAT superfamily N-acetyltransferase
MFGMLLAEGLVYTEGYGRRRPWPVSIRPEKNAMIRPTTPEETPTLVALAGGTKVFKPHELEALQEVLDEYHAANHSFGHRAVSYEKDGKVIGFAYYAPAAMTDHTWYLYWIAVERTIQAKGVGAALLHHSEKEILAAGGRLYLIETSSLPEYDPTRKFYLKHGYEKHAIVKDFYTDGDDLIVFRKHLRRDEKPATP